MTDPEKTESLLGRVEERLALLLKAAEGVLAADGKPVDVAIQAFARLRAAVAEVRRKGEST